MARRDSLDGSPDSSLWSDGCTELKSNGPSRSLTESIRVVLLRGSVFVCTRTESILCRSRF
jgi:hypothetical protein